MTTTLERTILMVERDCQDCSSASKFTNRSNTVPTCTTCRGTERVMQPISLIELKALLDGYVA